MDDITYHSATEIKLDKKTIINLIAILVTNKFTQADVLAIYTALGDATQYNDYVGKIYTSAPTVAFSGGGGAAAAGTATVTNGILTSVAVTNPGHDYTSAPDVIFSGGGGAGAAAHAVLSGSGDTIASVVVDNVSLIARLQTKIAELDAEFAGL